MSINHPVVLKLSVFHEVECCKVEGLFYERVHALECEFAEKFKPLFEKVGFKWFLFKKVFFRSYLTHSHPQSCDPFGQRHGSRPLAGTEAGSP